jgi:hypothetical protein
MHVTDMVMHIDNTLGTDSRRNVERAITGNKGVLEIMAQVSGQQLCAERVG